MVPGFNTDFKYRGETYHIQTEDNGAGNPVVVTLLYHKGAILASRRTSYRELAARPGYEPELMALMKNQHKDLMRALLAGEFDKNGTAPAVPGGTGEDPAHAAAAVATQAPPAPPRRQEFPARDPLRTQPPPVAAPVAPAAAIPQPLAPAAPPTAAAPARPAPPAAPVAPVAPVAPMIPDAPAPAARPRTAATTLDEAIRHYLEEFAATASAAAGAR
jgi:hypothetical protein